MWLQMQAFSKKLKTVSWLKPIEFDQTSNVSKKKLN